MGLDEEQRKFIYDNKEGGKLVDVVMEMGRSFVLIASSNSVK